MDSDLLQPTLREEHDSVDFNKPWRPWSLVVLTFFFGLPAGGALLALNFKRLGLRRSFAAAACIVVAATLVLAGARAWAVSQGMVNLEDREQRRLLNFGMKAAATVAAMALAAAQRTRYRVFEGGGGQGGNLWGPGVLAAAASIAIQVLLELAFRQLFGK
jgi:hypothetical protein